MFWEHENKTTLTAIIKGWDPYMFQAAIFNWVIEKVF